MVSLKTVGERFEIPLQVIEGGSGTIMGVLSETDQNAQPAYVFVQPRHVLRTAFPTALKIGMVLRTTAGSTFIVGDNGPSENARGILFQSFRLFEPTGRYLWQRRKRRIDPITKAERDDGLEDKGMVWAAIEAMEREVNDSRLRTSFEQSRFITAAPLRSDDLLDNRPVTKVDKQLGLSIGVLT
jgi:hypothetical protein